MGQAVFFLRLLLYFPEQSIDAGPRLRGRLQWGVPTLIDALPSIKDFTDVSLSSRENPITFCV